jgi:hypothetical protein
MSSMICYTSEMRLRIEPAKVLARLGTSGASRGAAPPPGLEKAIRSVGVASEPRLARLHLPVAFLPGGLISLDGYCPRSADLARRLEGCRSCTIFMLTLGVGLDSLLESASSSPSRQVMLDAAASEAAEDCARWVQRIERAEASRAGRKAVPRFSPGFGDFSLDSQAFFVQRLPGLGVTISGGGMLIPRKTVTGVIGWQ